MSRYYTGYLTENLEIKKYLKNELKEKHLLFLIPSSFENPEKIKKHMNLIIDFLNSAAISFDEIYVLEKDNANKYVKEKINKANLIYLMGGDPNTQLDIIAEFELENEIRNSNAAIVGMSAGAMCMSKYSWMLPVSERYPNMDIRKAINLSGISIYPHYNTNGEVLESYTNGEETTLKKDILFAAENYGDCYYLNDESAIIENNGELIFVGKNIIHVSKDKTEIINR
jgi:cyanophycinase